MITVTLKYGLSKSLNNIEVEEGTTVDDLICEYSSLLGLPESVNAVIRGTVTDSSSSVSNGDVIVFEKAACSKA